MAPLDSAEFLAFANRHALSDHSHSPWPLLARCLASAGPFESSGAKLVALDIGPLRCAPAACCLTACVRRFSPLLVGSIGV